ncbi:fimbrial protein [Enterobacter cloacae]|uniref:fimbrial protein n=1 Tax=Enterobacter cloacae TaxID=550 RepID=UPI002B207C5B|nr:hypothetical protein [Enterobacter cloacae]MEA5217582.1 hypothetical protein [Enterobacter cloacae]
MRQFFTQMLRGGLCSIGLAGAADAAELTVKTAVTEGSCQLSVPSAMTFSGQVPAQFVRHHWTADLKPLRVMVSDCQGTPGVTQRPGIQVTGETLPSHPGIFSDATSQATHAGFMLREGQYTRLDSFYTEDTGPGGSIPGGGFSYEGETGTVMNTGERVYTLGFVSDGVAPTYGQVTARLTFTFLYH